MIHLIQEKSLFEKGLLHLGIVRLGVGAHAWMIWGTCLVINHKGQMGTCFSGNGKIGPEKMFQSAQLTV